MAKTSSPSSGAGASLAAKVVVMLACLFGGIVVSYVVGNDSLVLDSAAKRPPPPSMEEMAAQGDARAQYVMGMRLARAKSEAPGNLSKAVQYLLQAQAQGYAAADKVLCPIWASKGGLEYAPDKAVPLCAALAAKGDMRAQAMLGLMYDVGGGVEKDRVKAGKFFEAAATGKDAIGAYYLAQSYRRGMRGFSRDLEKAIEWYEVAARGRVSEAAFQLVSIYGLKGLMGAEDSYEEAVYWLKFAKRLTPEKTAAFIKKKSHSCMTVGRLFSFISDCEVLARYGDASAQFTIADKYFYASDEKRDLKKAEEWARKAALQKNGAAQYLLAEILAAQSPEGQTEDRQMERYIWYATAGNSIENSGFKRLAAKAHMEKIWAAVPTEHRKELAQRAAENVLLYAVQEPQK